MGRLKKNHGGYHTSGLWLKYQQPTVNDTTKKPKSKKDTRKWCGGKTGKEHKLYRYFHELYSSRVGDWIYSDWIRTRCATCGKQFHQNNPSVPLDIPIKGESESLPIQVKVDGKYIPIDPERFYGEWCYACRAYHPN